MYWNSNLWILFDEDILFGLFKILKKKINSIDMLELTTLFCTISQLLKTKNKITKNKLIIWFDVLSISIINKLIKKLRLIRNASKLDSLSIMKLNWLQTKTKALKSEMSVRGVLSQEKSSDAIRLTENQVIKNTKKLKKKQFF